MDGEFVQHALSNGEEGKQWLEAIPDTIAKYAQMWSLKVLPPFNLSYSYVAPAVRQDGTRVLLKTGFPKDKEFQTEISALSVFNGQGVAKLLEADRENAVILIEHVQPGIPLSTLRDDEESTRILAHVMRKLWKPLPPNHGFITVAEWSQAIPELKKRKKISKL